VKKQKVEEIAAAKAGWTESLNKLAQQNAKLKLDLEENEKNKNEELIKLKYVVTTF